MKDYILGIALAVVLMFSFSETEFTPTGRSGTLLPGESEVVLPGGGAEPVDVVVFQVKEADKSESTDIETEEAKKEIPLEINVGEVKEKDMNDMLLMFWHGVVAVLIGEISALLVAIAWRKEHK